MKKQIEQIISLLKEVVSVLKELKQQVGDIDAKFEHVIERDAGFRKASDLSSYAGNYYEGDGK